MTILCNPCGRDIDKCDRDACCAEVTSARKRGLHEGIERERERILLVYKPRIKKFAEMHRRAQRAEHKVRRLERALERQTRRADRMEQIVCLAWDILPPHIRDEITAPKEPRRPWNTEPRDLVRGIAMLWERGKAALREGVEAAIEYEQENCDRRAAAMVDWTPLRAEVEERLK